MNLFHLFAKDSLLDRLVGRRSTDSTALGGFGEGWVVALHTLFARRLGNVLLLLLLSLLFCLSSLFQPSIAVNEPPGPNQGLRPSEVNWREAPLPHDPALSIITRNGITTCG